MAQQDTPPFVPATAMGAGPQPALPSTQPSWLDRVISILHPAPQTEHPLAHAARLVGRADQLESQLDALQKRSSQ